MDQNLSALLGCLACLLPFVLGAFFGAWFSGRLARWGFPGALIPNFIRRLLERIE